MIPADIPENEQQRLQALYRYDILDTQAEQVFDDLTELASEICDTPIALISLIDPDRQWFKSKVGLDAEETERDIAFCAHAIHQKDIFEVADTHNDQRFADNPLVRSDPNIRSYAGMPLLTPDGYAIGTLCTISDKPKQLDSHQRKALSILGREVISQLELRLKVKQVEQADKRKTDFLSSLSHELRTPLNAIISFSQLLVNDKELILPATAVQYLQHIEFSGKRLLDLVNSVLDLKKIEAGKFELAPQAVNIRAFASSIEGIARALATSRHVNIAFSFSGASQSHFIIDEARLSQILLNLISNAIKFSYPDRTVTINFLVSEDSLTFAVKDQGVGIAKHDLPKVFDQFYQVDQSTRHEGAGLGLMITKKLVDLMGGTIKLTSELASGTLVKVDIPVQLSAPPETDQLAPSHGHNFAPNARILVVEDNPINQEVAKAIFASLELGISLADSGEAAISLLQHKHFDLIFMDLHMPGLDGFETSKQITQQHPGIPIVALTADVLVDDDQKLTSCGIRQVLTKPILINQLVGVLNQFCPPAQTEQQA